MKKVLKVWLIIVLAVAVVHPKASSAFVALGGKLLETTSILPLLQRQLREARKALRMANKQLGELKSLKRGIKNVRRYATDLYEDPYHEILTEMEEIEAEVDVLRKGGVDTTYTFDNLPQYLQTIYIERAKQDGLAFEDFSSDLSIAKQAQISSKYTQDITLSKLLEDQQKFRQANIKSESISESSKITNEGLGLLLKTSSETLRIEKELLNVESIKLKKDIHAGMQKAQAHHMDEAILTHAFVEVLE